MLGYDTPQDMVLAMLDDAETHLDAMVSFITAAHLDDELRAHNWAAFARGYNGPQYAKNAYDKKLAAAFAKWSKIRDTAWAPGADAGAAGGEPVVAVTPAAALVPVSDAVLVPMAQTPTAATIAEPKKAEDVPANPHPTPVEQASKSVGAGKWTAIVGTCWTAVSAFLIATPSVPAQYRDPVLLAGVGTLLTTLASIVGAYAAPANALPVVVAGGA